MTSIRKLLVCSMLPFAFAAGTAAHAEGIGRSGTYVRPPNAEMTVAMDTLSPGEREQYAQIESRMMQAQIDHDQAVMQEDIRYRQVMMDMQNQLLKLYRGH
jgi:hypothetical protein